MAIQTSTTTTSGNLTQYEKSYRDGARAVRLYDQLASTMKDTFEPRGSTVTASWYGPLVPRPTTALGSETSDFDPQTIKDFQASITKYYRADGVKWHDLVGLKSSLRPDLVLPKAVGELAMRTIDLLARRVATEGNFYLLGDGTVSTRAALDLGTSGHHLSLANFMRVRTLFGNFIDNGAFFAIITPAQYEDLLNTTGSVITSRMAYTESGKEMLYNFELGELAGIRLIVSPDAKVFGGAGATNGTTVATTIASATEAGAKTCDATSVGSAAAGMWFLVGTEQGTIGTTETDAMSKAEVVYCTDVSSSTLTIQGKGPNGGFLYPHDSLSTLLNSDSVHCAIFGHSASMAVDFDEYGRYGKLIPPFQDGNAKQWTTASFKVYTGYGILNQNNLIRVETSASAF